LVLFALTFAILIAKPANCQADEKDKPNILFIFADDHSYDSVHATGNDEVQTPNIDTIARAGTRFNHTYNMGAWGGAVCMASRAMLNSGRFVWHAHKLKMKDEADANRTWSMQMKSAGYETYFTGKWHVAGLKPDDVFDNLGTVRGGMPKQTPEGYNRPVEGEKDKWSPYDKSKGGFWEGGKHWSEVIGDEAVGFLDSAKTKDSPFFMYVAFNAPHDPRQSPKEFVDKYPLESISIPPDFQPEYPYKDAIGNSAKLRDEKLAPFPRTHHSVKVNRQEYYAIITHMDQQIGRILDALKASGKSENTYIFFTADHGLAVGHHGLIGKQNMHEHSVRVPFFVQGPGVPKNVDIDSRIYLQDVMPTTMQLAGVKEQEFVNFKSLLPLMSGESSRHYESIYGGYKMLQRMVIKDDMKLIVYPTIKKVLLYDLKADPLEMKDLSTSPNQNATIEALFAELLKLQKETGDELDLSSVLETAASG
jgi:choline-sulfatase